MQLEKMVHLEFDIVFTTGGRISGSGTGNLEVGSMVDANLQAIRDPITGDPYLPGSSIKGKLRSIVEKVENRIWNDGGPCRCGRTDCPVCPLFGAHMKVNADSAPTRITVRDAFLTPAAKAKWEEAKAELKEPFEQKTENIVERIAGTAKHPRTGERVPPGTAFHAHIIVSLYDRDRDKAEQYEKTLSNALAILENSGSLGASGSRGYGEVRLENLTKREFEAKALSVTFKSI